MDFEFFTDSVEEDYAFGVEDYDNEQLVFEAEGDEGQRCGICMDVVVDRGVIDCCEHWFCFSCIDNWASITNLCPLCQNEFQLITCVPVYDTIGGIQLDDDSHSGDDDWSVEGNNNTLSFPSYYIDENAVSCLEGDSCKIRGQPTNVEEDPNLDTSIACDSCDLWYHAICVGFDPDGSCETSWLCPRCLADETSRKSEIGPSNKYGLDSSSHECSVNSAFPMNVSVSVADAGETAVVVSIIERNQHAKSCGENMLSVNSSKDLINGNQENEEKNLIMLPGSDLCEDMVIKKTSADDNCKSEKILADEIIKKPKIEAVEFDFSSSQGTLVSESLEFSRLGENSKEKTIESIATDGFGTSEFYDKYYDNKSLESGHYHASSVGTSLDKSETTGEVEEKHVSKEYRLPADKNPDKKEKASGITGAKRKQRDNSAMERETQARISTNAIKTERRSLVNDVTNETDDSVPLHLKKLNSTGVGREIPRKRRVETDITDIVQGPYRRPSNRITNLGNKSSEDKETSSRLRIKKVIRRTAEGKESLMAVQNLRKEIRDAIRNRSSKELKENLFDPNLLAAFRTAIATGTNRPPPLDVKAKKALLQKGTVRENLTKKIYGVGGKRKRAWTRDCEIEFWKHRCLKVSKPEKIETLKSVLDLLRKGPEVVEVKKENTVETSSSILSRLYVADSSVFPRKADIKPLSVLKTSTPSTGNNSSKFPEIIEPNKKMEQSSRSTGGLGFSMNSQKETGIGSNNVKIDKKKWALEVLARKNAGSGNASSQGQDNAVLKGNYPLLAKLPVDMRPSLAPSRHNKISISVRQAQLYRLTEHFLRKTNMPVTRPSAEIELAVADAVNVEKAVADKSNSKLVYINLCSQELLRRSDNINSTTTPDSEPPAVPPAVLDDNSATRTTDVPPAVLDDNSAMAATDVDEALRNAGLLSDSPPNSPLQEADENGPENVFEIDSQQELDIYGDFEYDLEDDDFLGARGFKTSNLEQEGTKMKMLFSTLDSSRSGSTWRFEDHEAPIAVENANEDSMKEKDVSRSFILEGGEEGSVTKENDVSRSFLLEGGEKEGSVDECEILYGPDKEPLINKYPEMKLTANSFTEVKSDQESKVAVEKSEIPDGNCSENLAVADLLKKPLERVKTKNKPHVEKKPESDKSADLRKKPLERVETRKKSRVEKKPELEKNPESDKRRSVLSKVEAYIKEHIRPLCKSGVITVEQYRWAVGKTTDKIMKYHSKDTSANFLIKEGEKVKKLAEQYVEAAQKVENKKPNT